MCIFVVAITEVTLITGKTVAEERSRTTLLAISGSCLTFNPVFSVLFFLFGSNSTGHGKPGQASY